MQRLSELRPGRLVTAVLTNGGLALSIASIVDGLLALAFTLVFARILGPSDYGSLAALVSIFLIGSLVGTSLQMTVARRLASESARHPWHLRRSGARWAKGAACVALIALLVCAVARETMAREIGIKEQWAVALILPSIILDIGVSLQRGLLIGRGAYRMAAMSTMIMPAGWLLFGGSLAAAGLGLTGVVIGIGLAEICAILLLHMLVRRLPAESPDTYPLMLTPLIGDAWRQLLTLGLIAILQNLDVIMVRRLIADGSLAGMYAAAAVGGKTIFWVALGLSQYLLPEAAKTLADERRSRKLLIGSVGIIFCCSVPMFLLFAFAGDQLLMFVFGQGFAAGGYLLPPLAIAMSLLSVAYICLQLLIARRDYKFLSLLVAATLFQPIIIVLTAPDLERIAWSVAIVNLAITIFVGVAAARKARSNEG